MEIVHCHVGLPEGIMYINIIYPGIRKTISVLLYTLGFEGIPVKTFVLLGNLN